nr:5987_t:CDS:2 [Entrophospora candida]
MFANLNSNNKHNFTKLLRFAQCKSNQNKDCLFEVEVESNDTLVPPALTLCIEKDLEYYFSVKVHGIETGNDHITKFESNDPNLTKYGLNVAKCWAHNEITIKYTKNPNNRNVEAMIFTLWQICSYR